MKDVACTVYSVLLHYRNCQACNTYVVFHLFNIRGEKERGELLAWPNSRARTGRGELSSNGRSSYGGMGWPELGMHPVVWYGRWNIVMRSLK
jgi:hypothetical protein